jgi:alpha-ribazole phosphatase
MDDRVVIALFRHGLTEENIRKAYLGWNDSPLCFEARQITTNREYDRYFSSDLQRCISTAKILFPGACPSILKEFREMNFGMWEGKTYDDLKNNPLYQRWLSDPLRNCPPEGEFFGQFTNRVKKGWDKIIHLILSQNLTSCAIITHGGVIRYLLSELAPEEKEFWIWEVPHTSGFELIFTRETLRRGGRCTLLQEVPLTVKGRG